jgi:hypothetical protein
VEGAEWVVIHSLLAQRHLKMKSESPIECFKSHMDAMIGLVEFMQLLPNTLQPVMAILTREQREGIRESSKHWIGFNKALYGLDGMYVSPPQPIAMGSCSTLELSDEIKARVGKCHPFFDFINAPFTHPLGTQLSLVCINYCWDAYDTFIKMIISVAVDSFPTHPNVNTYLNAKTKAKHERRQLATDEQLSLVGLAVTDSSMAEFLKQAAPTWTLAHANAVLNLAKLLRSIFTHHFGMPDDKLREFLSKHNFDAVRIQDDHFEVLTPLVADISKVVQGKRHGQHHMNLLVS